MPEDTEITMDLPPSGAFQGSEIEIRLSSITHTGLQRERNEDSLCVLDRKNLQHNLNALFVVADGMGGHLAGEVASSIAVDTLRSHALCRERCRLGNSDSLSDWLEGAVRECNDRVYEAGQSPDRSGMGTTITAGVIDSGVLYLAHVGDSRAYLLSSGHLVQLTADHTWLREAQYHGLLTPQQAMDHPDKGV